MKKTLITFEELPKKIQTDEIKNLVSNSNEFFKTLQTEKVDSKKYLRVAVDNTHNYYVSKKKEK